MPHVQSYIKCYDARRSRSAWQNKLDKLYCWSEVLPSTHICFYWQEASLWAVIFFFPPFSSLHLLHRVNSLHTDTLPLFPFSQSLFFSTWVHSHAPFCLSLLFCLQNIRAILIFPVRPAPFTLIDSGHLWLAHTGSLPGCSYFPLPNALLWSHRSPYWWQPLAMVHERVSRVPRLLLHHHCGYNAIITPHYARGKRGDGCRGVSWMEKWVRETMLESDRKTVKEKKDVCRFLDSRSIRLMCVFAMEKQPDCASSAGGLLSVPVMGWGGAQQNRCNGSGFIGHTQMGPWLWLSVPAKTPLLD